LTRHMVLYEEKAEKVEYYQEKLERFLGCKVQEMIDSEFRGKVRVGNACESLNF
jgi:hypothetical protein